MPRAFQSLIANRQQVSQSRGAVSGNRIIDFLMRAQQRRTEQQQPAKQSGRRRKNRIKRRPSMLPAERGIDDYR